MDNFHEVLFVWPDTSPRDVILTGSFDQWAASLHLTKVSSGFEGKVKLPWNTRVPYKFIVDGTWMTLQSQPEESDNSGNLNNIYDSPCKPEDDRSEPPGQPIILEVPSSVDAAPRSSIVGTDLSPMESLGRNAIEDTYKEPIILPASNDPSIHESTALPPPDINAVVESDINAVVESTTTPAAGIEDVVSPEPNEFTKSQEILSVPLVESIEDSKNTELIFNKEKKTDAIQSPSSETTHQSDPPSIDESTALPPPDINAVVESTTSLTAPAAGIEDVISPEPNRPTKSQETPSVPLVESIEDSTITEPIMTEEKIDPVRFPFSETAHKSDPGINDSKTITELPRANLSKTAASTGSAESESKPSSLVPSSASSSPGNHLRGVFQQRQRNISSKSNSVKSESSRSKRPSLFGKVRHLFHLDKDTS